MIYRLTDKWPLEHSPSIDKSANTDTVRKNITARALVSDEHPEILAELDAFHCIPVGEDYPFITVELAEYLEPYIGDSISLRPAEIIYKGKAYSDYLQLCINTERDCIEIEQSAFKNNTIAYAKFKEHKQEGCWVSNMPYTQRIIQICSPDFEKLISNSKFSENSFKFLYGCAPFASYMTEYFRDELLKALAEMLEDPDYQKNPFLLKNKRPDIFGRIIKIGKLPGEHIKDAATKNLSKDEFLALLTQRALDTIIP